MSKRTVNRLQNLVLVALSLSALFLLTRIPLFGGKWANQVHAFLTSPAAVQVALEGVNCASAAAFSASAFFCSSSLVGTAREVRAARRIPQRIMPNKKM